MTYVYVIQKSNDFTEDRMGESLHMVVDNYDTAEKYVMKQPGIMGTRQQCHDTVYCTDTGEWIKSIFNGYTIKRVKVISEEDIMTEAEISDIINDLEAQISLWKAKLINKGA